MAIIVPTLFIVLYFSLDNFEGKQVNKVANPNGNIDYSIPQNQLSDSSLYTASPIPNSIQVTVSAVGSCGRSISSPVLFQSYQ